MLKHLAEGDTGRARRLVRRLLLAVSLLWAAAADAGGTIESPLVTVIGGAVHSTVVADGVLYIGGSFTQVSDGANTLSGNVAAIELDSGVIRWTTITAITTPAGPGTVQELELSAGGTVLFIGGEFDTVEGDPRGNLAALAVVDGDPVNGWVQAPSPDGIVRALARSADGLILYIGGEFNAVGAESRNRIASVDASTGALLPWVPDIDDGTVQALALDGPNARLFVGGTFTTIDAEPHNRLAALGLANAGVIAGIPAVTSVDPGDVVNALLLAGETLYIGGEFSALGGTARDGFAAIELDSLAVTGLDPGIGGAVRVLASDAGERRLYVGGDFSFIDSGGLPRDDLAAFRIDGADPGDRLLAWDPGTDASVLALATVDSDRLFAGGDFTTIDGVARDALASFAIAPPETDADPPAGGHQLLNIVTLSCMDQSGAGCARVCATDDGSEPDPATDCVAADEQMITIAQSGITTLRFFSEDNDGNREALRTARYAIDDQSPTTTALPPPLPDGQWFGEDTLEPIVLECADNLEEFGCTTHYTLNNTAPDTGSTVFSAPLTLASLLPPDTIPEEEVDPLQHMSDVFTLRFFSIDDAGNAEPEQALQYRVDLAAPEVAPSLPGGSYIAPQSIALSCDDGNGSGCADIYYTLDNSPPSDGSVLDAGGTPIAATPRYQEPLTLDSATTITVYAVDNAGNGATEVVGIYSFSQPGTETETGVGALDRGLLAGMLALVLARRLRGRR